MEMKIRGLVFLFLFGAAVCSASSFHELDGDAAAGKEKASACVACHSLDGNSKASMWPKIAGQNEKYIYKQLMDFKKGKSGGRYDPSMTPLMQSLSQKDMANLAVYYAGQKAAPGYADKTDLALGEQIYRGGNLKTHVAACMGCHGPQGLGNRSAAFPALSGQHAQYTEKQLRDYKAGTRTNSPNEIMVQIAKRMSDKEIKAVSNYIEGLH